MGRLGKTADHIVSAAFELACAHGIDCLGSRSVSRHAAITASAINYHFGGFDQLKAEVARMAWREYLAALRSALSAVRDLPDHLRSMPNFAASLATHMATIQRGKTLLLEELGSSSDFPAVAPDHFWREAASHFPDASFAEIWKLFFVGALRLAVLDGDGVATPMWVHRLAQRVEARLARRADPAVPDPPDRPESRVLKGGEALPDGAQRIVDAAIQLIVAGKKVSHRQVAELSGVPLGSTTYFFPGKSEIVFEAYRQIYTMVIRASQERHNGQGKPFLEDGRLEPHYLAVRRIGLSAARDPLLLPLARAIRVSRGKSSTEMLRRSGIADADRLDGLIWSCFNVAAEYLARSRAPGPQRQALFTRQLADVWRALFGGEMNEHVVG